MYDYKTDVAVALIFFNRADTLEKVFEQVRIARPSKLFLIQDGARKGNEKDKFGIERCRRVFEGKIDWKCEVIRDFSEENLGCGMRVYSGIRNAFERVDKLIILEDDCVPSQSMFTFCKELLDKYEKDQRICSISGMNHLGEYNPNGRDYFFCSTGTIWGWATWKRVWEYMDYEMSFQNDEYAMKTFDSMYYNSYIKKSIQQMGMDRKKQWQSTHKLSSWTYQFRMIRHLQSQLVIVPTKNLVSNIGVTGDATHATDSLKKMPRGIQKVFFIPTYEYEIPLKHPKYVMCDTNYDKQVWKIMGESRRGKFFRKLESLVRRVLFYDVGDYKSLIKSMKRNL